SLAEVLHRGTEFTIRHGHHVKTGSLQERTKHILGKSLAGSPIEPPGLRARAIHKPGQRVNLQRLCGGNRNEDIRGGRDWGEVARGIIWKFVVDRWEDGNGRATG